MSYVRHVLQDGEEIRHIAKIHWIIFVPGLVDLAVAICLLAAGQALPDWAALFRILAAVAFIGGLIHLTAVWINRWTTEIAVTSRRVIYKTGLIRRDTNEMNMNKVESVKVDQTILGRLLDYGDVTILGTGAGLEPLRRIDAPISLRNHITGL